MLPRARHDVLVLSDSDIVVGPDYLRTLAALLSAPGVGAVTCLYHGIGGDSGLSSPISRTSRIRVRAESGSER